MESDGAVKSLVLMSDGVNTKSAQYPYHTKNLGVDANRILDELCDEAKGKGITIYTIAFEVTDSTVRNLLEDCASSRENFFNATDSAALSDAFAAIGMSLTELALTKINQGNSKNFSAIHGNPRFLHDA